MDMATVRLTEKLNKEIFAQSEVIFDERVARANIAPPQFNALDIYNLWLDTTPGLREDIQIGIRRKWLLQVASFSVKRLNSKKVDVFCIPYEPCVYVPYAIAYGAGIELNCPYADELYVIAKEFENNRSMVQNQRDQFNGQIGNLLKRHETLKQALAEWPALWEFVPMDMKKKHNEEKAKIAEQKIIKAHKPEVNLDVLNGAVVTHKILKSTY
jgi:hypothetical protein